MTGMWNSSRQVGQTTWSSNEQKLLLARFGSWPSGGLEGWAGACRAGTWSWTGPGKTEQSHAEAKAGDEGTCRGTPVLLLEAAICPWATATVIGKPMGVGGHKLEVVFSLSRP